MLDSAGEHQAMQDFGLALRQDFCYQRRYFLLEKGSLWQHRIRFAYAAQYG